MGCDIPTVERYAMIFVDLYIHFSVVDPAAIESTRPSATSSGPQATSVTTAGASKMKPIPDFGVHNALAMYLLRNTVSNAYPPFLFNPFSITILEYCPPSSDSFIACNVLERYKDCSSLYANFTTNPAIANG